MIAKLNIITPLFAAGAVATAISAAPIAAADSVPAHPPTVTHSYFAPTDDQGGGGCVNGAGCGSGGANQNGPGLPGGGGCVPGVGCGSGGINFFGPGGGGCVPGVGCGSGGNPGAPGNGG
jgi:hypothetical protein